MDEPTITQDQAVVRIDALFAAARNVADPKPRLEPVKTQKLIGPCFNPDSGTGDDRIIITKRSRLMDISVEMNSKIAKQIKAYWEKQGFHIDHVEGLSSKSPSVFATAPDKFGITLSSNDLGDMSLISSSPCIWQDGTPGKTPDMFRGMPTATNQTPAPE